MSAIFAEQCLSPFNVTKSLLIISAINALVFLTFSQVRGDTAFYSRNQNPFIQVFGLPAAESAALTEKNQIDGRVVLDLANNFSLGVTDNERIILDGESNRITCAFRYGLTESVELGFDIPYISHERGTLDNFISDWHDFFGLPDGDRDNRNPKLLEYEYEKNGDVLHRTDSASHGLGDIFVSSAFLLYGNKAQSRNISLRLSLKLPTGSSEDLHGSGGTDFSWRLAADDALSLSSWKITYWGSAGLLFLGKGDVLEEIRNDLVGFGSMGAGWKIFDWAHLKLQLDGHTAVFDSALEELGDGAVQLNMGTTIHFDHDLSLDLNVIEDIMVNSSPDVVFHVAIRKKL